VGIVPLNEFSCTWQTSQLAEFRGQGACKLVREDAQERQSPIHESDLAWNCTRESIVPKTLIQKKGITQDRIRIKEKILQIKERRQRGDL
jgi:hypothetical protein